MHKLLVIFCAVFLLVACDNNIVISETKSLPNGWDKNEAISFTLPQLDTLKAYNMFINIRNSNDYPYNNLFLVASIEFPHGKVTNDTLEYKMAYPDGAWMGEGIGSIKENKLWFKENFRFTEEGNYNITITQAVRNIGEVDGVSQLPGITDVGISIEEASQFPSHGNN